MEKDLALIEQFLDALWLEKNLAENTLSAYRRDLTMLVEWLAHRELTLESVQHDDLQALLGERMDGGYKATRRLLGLFCLALAPLSVGAQQGQTVRIAFIAPLSGPAADIGHNSLKSWQFMAERLNDSEDRTGVRFVIEPHVRFKGEVGEQATMFFLDPSGNALEFKAFKDLKSLFAK